MPRNKKILLACTHSFGAKFFEGQLTFLNKAGFDVYVIAAEGKEIEALCKKENAIFINYPFSRSINPLKDLKAVSNVSTIIKRLKPDIINAGTPKAGLIVVLASKLAGVCPVVFTLRGLRSETLTGFKKWVVKTMEKATCYFADKVICISPSLYNHAVQHKILKKEKGIVIKHGSSNGIDISRFSRDNTAIANRQELRDRFGIKEDDFVIGFVGRINNDKGVPALFKVFKQLKAQYKHVKLLLVGKFEKEDAIDSMLKESIIENPDITIISYTDQVETLYVTFDVLVLYSRREGFGNVLIEAAAMEVPVIAADIPGARDAVSHNFNGYLVNKDNTAELFDKLESYIQHPTTKEEHAKNGRIWVEENFKSEVIWSGQVEAYNELISQ